MSGVAGFDVLEQLLHRVAAALKVVQRVLHRHIVLDDKG